MILQKILPDYYDFHVNKIFSPPFGMDDPSTSFVKKHEWYNHPIKNYTYAFNSWGFRGDDYSLYKNQSVNICLGDSFTVNIGGPIEHSWASQMSSYFDIPTLNFGVDGAGNDTIRMIYEYLVDYFNVQNTFVMYSFFHRRYYAKTKKLKYDVHADEENFNYFEKNKLENVYYTFLPPWCWSVTEQKYLNDYYYNQISFYKNFDFEFLNNNHVFFTVIDKYNKFKGANWPSYEELINNKILQDHIHHEIFRSPISQELFHPVNRDGFHLNYAGNKMVCDYFLSQINHTPK